MLLPGLLWSRRDHLPRDIPQAAPIVGPLAGFGSKLWEVFGPKNKRPASGGGSSPFVNSIVNAARSGPSSRGSQPSSVSKPPTDLDRWNAALGAYGLPDGVNDPVSQAVIAQQERNRQRQAEMQAQYDRTLSELMGRFNFGEDPYQRSLRDNALADLANQLTSAKASIGQSYDRGQGDLRANADAMRAEAAAQGAQLAALFNSGAGAVNAGNASTGAAYAGDYGMLGAVGPAQGAAVDIAAEMAAAAPREQALAESIGQTYANTANTLASLMSGYSASEQAATERDAAAMRQSINAEFGSREAERIARERESYNNMAMQLANQLMGYQQDFANRDDEMAMMLAEREAQQFDAAREFYNAQNVDALMKGGANRVDPGDTSMYNVGGLQYMTKDGNPVQVPGWQAEQAIRAARVAASTEAGDANPDAWNRIFIAVLQESLGEKMAALPESWIQENLRR
jgi:hypothetical protein